MNTRAKSELSFPQSNSSGTKINSNRFIMATIIIWVIAFNLDFNFETTQIAIIISETPMARVNGLEKSSPIIFPTICSCLGTRFKILQTSPLISQTAVIRMLNMEWSFLIFINYYSLCYSLKKLNILPPYFRERSKWGRCSRLVRLECSIISTPSSNNISLLKTNSGILAKSAKSML